MKNVKNAFFGKIKQFNKLKRKFYLFINSSDDAKILLSITDACPSEQLNAHPGADPQSYLKRQERSCC
jgi:hypothetical protein